MRDYLSKISFDVSNAFSYKVFMNSLPKNLKKNIYAQILTKALEEEKNIQKFGVKEVKFIVMSAMLEKYTFDEVYSKSLIPYSYLKDYFQGNPATIDYKVYTELGTNGLIEYVKANTMEQIEIQKNILAMIVMFSTMRKLKDNIIEEITDKTKNCFNGLFNYRNEQCKKELMSKYNVKNIKNGSFYKELKELLNKALYEKECWRYLHMKVNDRMPIKENYLQYHVMNIFLNVEKFNYQEEKLNKYQIRDIELYNYIAQSFDLQKIRLENNEF